MDIPHRQAIIEAANRVVSPSEYARSSIILVGSAAFGLADSYSDIDFRVYVDSDSASLDGIQPHRVIDYKGQPPLFGLVFSWRELEAQIYQDTALHAFILNKDAVILDHDGRIFEKLDLLSRVFMERQEFLAASKYVEFCARRNSYAGCVKRGDRFGADIYSVQATKAALECSLLSLGRPCPYPKWLLRYAEGISDGNECLRDVVAGTRFCADADSLERRESLLHIRDGLDKLVRDAFGGNPHWQAEWWRYLPS